MLPTSMQIPDWLDSKYWWCWSRLPLLLKLPFSHFSRVQLFVILWTGAGQTPLPTDFSSQEYCNGLPCLPPGDLPNPGIKPGSPALQADSLPLSHQGSPSHITSPPVNQKNVHMMITPCSLNTMTPHYPLQGGSFEGISHLWIPLPGKAIKLFFSTSCKTVSIFLFGTIEQRLAFSKELTSHRFTVNVTKWVTNII